MKLYETAFLDSLWRYIFIKLPDISDEADPLNQGIKPKF